MHLFCFFAMYFTAAKRVFYLLKWKYTIALLKKKTLEENNITLYNCYY